MMNPKYYVKKSMATVKGGYWLVMGPSPDGEERDIVWAWRKTEEEAQEKADEMNGKES